MTYRNTLIKAILLSTLMVVGVTFELPAQRNNTVRYYKSVMKKISKKPHSRIRIQRKMYDGDSLSYDYSITIYNYNTHTKKKNTAIVYDDIAYMVNARELRMVNFANSEFSIFTYSRDPDSWYMSVRDDLRFNAYNMLSCYVPELRDFRDLAFNSPIFSHICDTLVDSISYVALYAKRNIPSRYQLTYLYNPQTGLIDRLECVLDDSTAQNRCFTRIVSDIKVDDNYYELIDSLFNPLNRKYLHYTFHNDSNPPVSMSEGGAPELDTDTFGMVPANLLQYPLVNMLGDTSRLSLMDGWILVDFWFNNCAACLKWFEKVHSEYDSLGTSILEKNGIRIVSINPINNNIDILRRIVSPYGCESNIFTAKGLPLQLKIPQYPYFVLISPDKQLVYASGWINDYTQLLSRKTKYEKEHLK